MKKLVTKLFALAALMLLGLGSAWAQTGMAYATPVDHAVGSYHGFYVNGRNTPDAGHDVTYYRWRMWEVTSDNDETTQLTDFSKFQFVSWDAGAGTFGAAVGAAGVYNAQGAHRVGVQWLDMPSAGTVYALEVEEYNSADDSECSTRRRFYIETSVEVNVIVAAVEGSVGSWSTPADMETCNDMSGQIIANTATDWGTSVRYFELTMQNDGADWAGAWGFDYTVTATNSAGAVTVAVTVADEANAGDVVDTAGSVAVASGNATIVLAVTVDNTFGVPQGDFDITLNLGVDDGTGAETTAFVTLSGNDFYEDDATNGGDNTLGTAFTVKASPNTTVIGID